MSEENSKPDNQKARLADYFSPATGKTKLKIASWNMNNLGLAKATVQFINAVCEIITHGEFDLLALQEIWHPGVLEKMCERLNAVDDTQWASVTSRPAGRGFGKKERFAFLYKNKNIQCIAARLINFNIKAPKIKVPPEVGNHIANILVQMRAEVKNFTRKPFWGLFQINGVEFSLINVHLKANNPYTEREAECLKRLDDLVDLGTNVIILGDFNLHPNNQAMEGLRTEYEQGIPSEMTTNYNNNRSYDNIWLKLNANHATAGTGGVYMGPLNFNKGQDVLIDDESEDEGGDELDYEDEEEDEDENIEHAEKQGNDEIGYGEGHVINLISDHRPVHVTLSFTGEIEHV